jgi:glutathione synthase/RimK-type ligase-like ATP-grasp enzyme
MGSNGSKPYQTRLIARHGFLTPPTLITNDPDAVRAFVREYGEVVFKSISSVRSIVTRLTSEHLATLDRVRFLPTQFQAWMPGVDFRLHVIGERTFATEVQSSAVDYRYARREGGEATLKAARLDPDLARRCVALAHDLDLPFCGIDLKLRERGEPVCFEVNPSPAYSYYQESTGQPIARALVEYLAGWQE